LNQIELNSELAESIRIKILIFALFCALDKSIRKKQLKMVKKRKKLTNTQSQFDEDEQYMDHLLFYEKAEQ
jgi:hypothetical protein